MYIPYDDGTGIHPQDSHFLEREVWDLEATPADRRPLLLHYHPLVIYRFQVLKQADVVLALFLQGDHFTLEEKRADFDYYDPITTGDSTLSGVVQSIIAAEVGYRESGAALLLQRRCSSTWPTCTATPATACTWPRPAGCGTRWSTASAACATTTARSASIPGCRRAGSRLTFRITLRGTRLKVSVVHEAITFEIDAGDPVTLTVRGDQVTVTGIEPVVVPLLGQGPEIAGEPALHSGERRPDGTLIIASVPQALSKRQRR